MPNTPRDRDPAPALSVAIIREDPDCAQVLAAVTSPATDGKQINVKKRKPALERWLDPPVKQRQMEIVWQPYGSAMPGIVI